MSAAKKFDLREKVEPGTNSLLENTTEMLKIVGKIGSERPCGATIVHHINVFLLDSNNQLHVTRIQVQFLHSTLLRKPAAGADFSGLFWEIFRNG